MPFIDGKYVEYTPAQARAIREKTLHAERRPHLLRMIRPGEVATPLDHAVQGDVFPYYVVEGGEKVLFPSRAEAEKHMKIRMEAWEKNTPPEVA